MSNTVYIKCPACAVRRHDECVQIVGEFGNEFCECTHKDTATLSARDWANIRAQIQFAFLNIEDASDSNLEVSSSITTHSDGTMTFAVYRWEGNTRNYVANIEMKLNYSDKKGLVIY